MTATNTTGFDIQAGTAGEAVTVTVNNWTSVNGATHFNISQPNVTLNITNCDFSTGHSTFGILNTQSPFTLNVNGTQWNSNYPYQLSGASNAYTGDHNNFANLSFFNVTGIGSASTVPAWCVLSGQDCHSTP